MVIRISAIVFCVLGGGLARDVSAASALFMPGRAVGVLGSSLINEASGLAASRSNSEVLWVHNDSGDDPNVYALNSTGTYLGAYRLTGATARDWEDMAVGPGPVAGQSYLYLGDIGDNSAIRSTILVYRVAEPVVNAEQPPRNVALSGVTTFTLQYPDGPRDAETLMVDPINGTLYIVSKRDAIPRIYRASLPPSPTGTITMEFMGSLAWSSSSSRDYVTAGDVSPDGREVLIRSYGSAKIWSATNGMSVWDLLSEPGTDVPLAIEPQGEAIAFDAVGRNYYTVSEHVGQPIYVYERVPEPASAVLLATFFLMIQLTCRGRRMSNGSRPGQMN